MPEGDTVWRACKRLDQALAGQELTRTDFRVPSLATTDLSGRSVLEVVARGKHLLMRLSGGVTIHSHLRMDGSWHLYRPGEQWRGGPDHQVRAVLETSAWIAVGYRLPVLELVATDAEGTVVGHLGPDLLSPTSIGTLALANLAADPERTISEALLDQRNLAGIGNFYRIEVCFLLGLHPWRPVSVGRSGGRGRPEPAADEGEPPSTPRRSPPASTGRGSARWVFERAGKAVPTVRDDDPDGPDRRAAPGRGSATGARPASPRRELPLWMTHRSGGNTDTFSDESNICSSARGEGHVRHLRWDHQPRVRAATADRTSSATAGRSQFIEGEHGGRNPSYRLHPRTEPARASGVHHLQLPSGLRRARTSAAGRSRCSPDRQFDEGDLSDRPRLLLPAAAAADAGLDEPSLHGEHDVQAAG